MSPAFGDQLEVFPDVQVKLRARRTDPATSHEGYISLEALRASQRAVLEVFIRTGPMGDHRLLPNYVRLHDQHGPHVFPLQSPSGIRTRRRELFDLGWLIDTGRRELLPGSKKRHAIVWAINPTRANGAAR